MGAIDGVRSLWSPNSVKIAPGGTVTFAWSGDAAHDLSIPSVGYETRATKTANYVVTFPNAGTYQVICVIHDDTMRASVVVQ